MSSNRPPILEKPCRKVFDFQKERNKMTKKSGGTFLLIIAGLLPVWNGLQYFLEGLANQNSSLRNYAVVGQILFGLAIVGYGFFYFKSSGKRTSK